MTTIARRPRRPVAAPNVQHPRAIIAFWRAALLEPLFVYFIQEEAGGPVKVGKATDPYHRLVSLQCGNPRRLIVRRVILAAEHTESDIHAALADRQVGGEWFGDGFEDAILALAEEICRRQIAAYQADEGLDSIGRWVHRDVFCSEDLSP